MRKRLRRAGAWFAVLFGLAGVLSIAARPGGSAEAASATSTTGLTALNPARLLDTRVGLGATGPVSPGATVKLAVTDAPGEPSTGVGAVLLNVTVTQPTRAGYLTVFPDGTSRPATSNVNFVAEATVANLAVAAVGSDGSVDLYNGSGGTIQLIADISGWFPVGYPIRAGGLDAMSPARLLDTRVGLGATGPVPPGATVKLADPNASSEPPTGVATVALNVTVTQPTRAGYLTVFADDTPRPATSNVNFAAGATVAELVVSAVGSDHSIDLYNGSGGTIQLIADISGWFPGGYPLAPGGIAAINPARLLDTRVGLGATGPVPPGATVKLAATNAPGEPSATVGAVALNVTVTQPTRAGWVSVFTDGTPRPATSNVNFAAGATVANLVVVPVGSDGSVDLYNGSGGTIQLIADIPAWFFLSS